MNKFKTVFNIVLVITLIVLACIIAISVYQGLNKKPIASNIERTMFSDISEPLTIDEIKQEFSAEASGKDISKYIYTISDDYSGNELITGDHKIVFGVTENSLTTIFHLTIRVVDVIQE